MNLPSKQLVYKYNPYQHQLNGIDETVPRLEEHGGAALFVDMGLGKSLIALSVARILYKEQRINRLLVICPKGITAVWKSEIHKHVANPPPIMVWDAQKSNNKSFQARQKEISTREEITIYIVNVEAFQSVNQRLQRFIKSITEDHRTLCVVDESSTLKNPQAKRTKELLKLAKDLDYRMIMTGTEITNSVLDLYSQFRFTVPGVWKDFKNYYGFRARYAVLEERPYNQGKMVKVVVGYRRVDELLNRIKPYIFRARKEDCFDLPEKVYATLPVELNAEQQKAYDELTELLYTQYKDQLITVTHAIALVTRFRQITGGFFPESGEPIGNTNPKVQALIDDLNDTDEKAIIWTAFRAEARAITEALRKHFGHDSVVVYTGDQSQDEREQAVEDFSKEARFFVANPQVAGYGLNLQFCTLQYFFSRTMQMAENKQAEDRSHRIGTKSTCVYKSVVATGTVDETILQSIMDKQTLLDGIQTMSLDKIVSILGGKSVDK